MVEVGGSNPPGPTKFISLCFYFTLFFQNRAFWGMWLLQVVTQVIGATLLTAFYLTLYVRMVTTTRGVSAITTPLRNFVAFLEPQK